MKYRVWDKLISLSDKMESRIARDSAVLDEDGMERFNKPGWVNRVYANENYRRAHIDIVDARGSKGLWMMHCCIFPHTHNNAPIFGYDVIAGENKITGFFHDFSPVSNDHPMSGEFKQAAGMSWKKERELPEWAKQIFSDDMIAAGNIKEDELDKTDIVLKTLEYYLNNVGLYNRMGMYKEEQNRYAYYQKQNPHTPKTMKALGLGDEDVDLFINKCLFPDL